MRRRRRKRVHVLARNNVTQCGAGEPTFLFAHGFGCDQNMWRHVVAPLANDATVVLFDHVGAGLSDLASYSSEKYGSLRGYAADVIEICEAIGSGPVTFVGHSVSATIGVLAAAARPDLFARLALVCPSPSYVNAEGYVGGFAEADIDELLDLLDKNQLDWSALMSPTLMGPGAETHEAEWRESVCRLDPVIARDFARVTFKSDHREDFGKVGTETLLIECSEDALAPPEVGAFLKASMTNSRRVILPAVGHCPHMSSPAAVIEALRVFALGPSTRAAA
jgi:sigma-B regulation protein RsbQ